MNIILKNIKLSFSVVENYALIPSYFSSTEGLACPATQFFKSIIVDGEAELVERTGFERDPRIFSGKIFHSTQKL